eukprot:jgi/Botrbrau1/4745/Bobra.0137s0017.1
MIRRGLDNAIRLNLNNNRPLRFLQGQSVWSTERKALHMSETESGGAPTGTPGNWQDKIIMKGLEFYGYHGCLPEEKRLGQKFVVDATLYCSLRQAGLSDTLSHSVDYAAVYKQIRQKVEGNSRDLIETLAEDIASQILAVHAGVHSVQVAVHKPHVALPGSFHTVGVEILRSRAGSETS